MLPLILAFLFTGVLLAFAALAASFFVVAFERHPASLALADASGDWQVPWSVRQQMRQWALSNAAATVARLMDSDGRAAAGPNGVLQSVYDAARSALRRLLGRSTAGEASSCPSCRHEMLGVTPLEAFAIAQQLTQHESPDRLAEIRAAAAGNARVAAMLDRDAYATLHRTCPLFSSGGLCAADPMRPLQCLGWCSAGNDGDAALSPRPASRLDDAVWNGVRQGLQAGAVASRLDASVYELNAAIVTALDTPEGAQHWARGEQVFQQCRKIE